MFSSQHRLVEGLQTLMFQKAGLQTDGKAPEEEEMAVRVGDETHNNYYETSSSSTQPKNGVNPGWLLAAALGGALAMPAIADYLRPEPQEPPPPAIATDTDTRYELRISADE